MQVRKNILVRGIPARLHKRMKMEALKQDRTLADVTISAFECYLSNGCKDWVRNVPKKRVGN